MSGGTDAEEKARARARLTALRRSLSFEDVQARGLRVQSRLLDTPQFQAARTVALYAALPGEVPTEALLAKALLDGKTVVYPVVPSTGRLLRFHSVGQAEHLLASGRLAIREPLSGRPTVELSAIELFVVPGLGFSRAGSRLGWGAGYYDATLGAAPSRTPRIGLAFSEHVVEDLPAGEQDVPVHFVLTEDSTFAAPGAAATVVGALPFPTR
jgi:5-formyltetrahydrofolate cyclo-ligase